MPQLWRNVRVFISSTFRDMQEERDEVLNREILITLTEAKVLIGD